MTIKTIFFSTEKTTECFAKNILRNIRKRLVSNYKQLRPRTEYGNYQLFNFMKIYIVKYKKEYGGEECETSESNAILMHQLKLLESARVKDQVKAYELSKI